MGKADLIREGERLDDLQNGLYIIQNPKVFCFGIDAVLLADFMKADKNDLVVDLCTGNGIIPVLLTNKSETERIFGVEIQKNSFDLAERTVTYNDLAERVKIIHADINNLASNRIFKLGSIDVISCNPPYVSVNGGLKCFDDEKTIARHEIFCTLKDVIEVSSKLLRFRGRLYLIHKPERLTELIVTMRQNSVEPKTIRFVHPNPQKPPAMVLIEGVRGGNPYTSVLPPLFIYNDNGLYTDEINSIYGFRK